METNLGAMWVFVLGLVLFQGGILNGDGMPLRGPILVPDGETNALIAIAQSLGLGRSLWPRGRDPCSAWVGVTCENGHVVGLSLSGMDYSANESQHPVFLLNPLLGLPSLKTLNVSNFGSPGLIPFWFGNLSLLESLTLDNSSLNGTIPAALGHLQSLQSLSLARNGLRGTIPAEFANLKNLTSLDLSSNELTGNFPSSLLNLTNLQMLSLSDNYFDGPIPENLTGLPNLQRLSLSGNMLNDSIPLQIGDLMLLAHIDMSSNNLSGSIPAGLGNLTRLVTLNLADNFINGTLPPELTLCSELGVLSLAENMLAGTLPPLLGSMVNLVNLNLSWNGLSGDMPSGWDRLQQLRTADLSHNLFYGPLPAELIGLHNLSMLNVSDNFFNGSLPSALPNKTISKKNCFKNGRGQHTPHSCAKFYAANGVAAAAPMVLPPAPVVAGSPEAVPHEEQYPSKKYKHLVPLLAGVGGGLGLILIAGFVALCVHKMERKGVDQERGANTDAGFGSQGPGIIVSRLGEAFTYAQLQAATKKFHSSNLIICGHSGDLYKGLLDRGLTVVVKRIDASKFRKDSYVPELEVYGKATHTRLVSLLGYCLEREDEKLLVYKYMPNGDLASALHTKGSPGPGDVLRSLDWITRLKVAIGSAEALSFLHQDCSPPLVHGDIKASSILLDDKFEVRLGSLSEVRSQDGDSHPGLIRRLLGLSISSDNGVRDPGQPVAACTLDVYNYGKVLLELVSGKLGISGVSDPRTDAWLDWAVPLIDPHDKESLPKLVDPSLIVDEDLLEEVWAVAIIAKACLNPKPQKRPSMRHVLRALENPHKVIRQDFQFGDTLAIRTSSHSSWNEALFGSWRHSSVIPGTLREEYSRGGIASGGRIEFPQSHARRGSSDIAPEPISENDHPRSR